MTDEACLNKHISHAFNEDLEHLRTRVLSMAPVCSKAFQS